MAMVEIAMGWWKWIWLYGGDSYGYGRNRIVGYGGDSYGYGGNSYGGDSYGYMEEMVIVLW